MPAPKKAKNFGAPVTGTKEVRIKHFSSHCKLKDPKAAKNLLKVKEQSEWGLPEMSSITMAKIHLS